MANDNTNSFAALQHNVDIVTDENNEPVVDVNHRNNVDVSHVHVSVNGENYSDDATASVHVGEQSLEIPHLEHVAETDSDDGSSQASEFLDAT